MMDQKLEAERLLKYPIILCLGFGIVVTLLQDSHLGKVRHYYQKKGLLAFDPHVTPYASIKSRASELKPQILRILEETESEFCHIVAHSKGGLDIRMLSYDEDIQSHIASIQTISSPHHGSTLANFRSKFPDFLVQPMLKTVDKFASKIHKEGESNIQDALDQLSPDYIENVFNPAYPLLESIPFFSYAGFSGIETDITMDISLKYFNNVIYKNEGINDGFVSVESAKWGTFVKTFPLAHNEQIGLGVKPHKKSVYYEMWDLILEKMIEVEQQMN